jgi:hypothetical protein
MVGLSTFNVERMFYSCSMGTSRRYAHRVDEQNAHRAQQVSSAPRPVGLSPIEVDLAASPARTAPAPIPIRAWVQFSPTPAQLNGVALEWNEDAVHIEVVDAAGRTHKLWVWASAVQRLPDELPDRP